MQLSYEDGIRHLDLKPGADEDEIKKAFRKLANRVHPDKRGGKEDDFKLAVAARDAALRGKKKFIFVETMDYSWLNKREKKSEKVFENEVMNIVKKEGGYTFKIHGHIYQKPGIPDIYIASKIWIGWLELKVEENTLDKDQIIVGDALRRRGDNVYCLRYEQAVGVTLEWKDQVYVVDTWPMEGFLEWLEKNT